MKYKRLKFSAILLLAIGLADLKAQEAIPTAGGNATGSGGLVSYSVGQVVFISSIGTSGSVTAGIQQPYEISVVTGINENLGISLICSAYPNPVKDFLILSIEGDLSTTYTAYLYNSTDVLIKKYENCRQCNQN